MRENATLFVVVPCYNEKEVLPETSKRLSEVLENMISKNKITRESRIVFVDDGSRDNTWEIICREHDTRPHVSGIKLSRNQGHQHTRRDWTTRKSSTGTSVTRTPDSRPST